MKPDVIGMTSRCHLDDIGMSSRCTLEHVLREDMFSARTCPRGGHVLAEKHAKCASSALSVRSLRTELRCTRSTSQLVLRVLICTRSTSSLGMPTCQVGMPRQTPAHSSHKRMQPGSESTNNAACPRRWVGFRIEIRHDLCQISIHVGSPGKGCHMATGHWGKKLKKNKKKNQ
jgi:hypothetical protein